MNLTVLELTVLCELLLLALLTHRCEESLDESQETDSGCGAGEDDQFAP